MIQNRLHPCHAVVVEHLGLLVPREHRVAHLHLSEAPRHEHPLFGRELDRLLLFLCPASALMPPLHLCTYHEPSTTHGSYMEEQYIPYAKEISFGINNLEHVSPSP